MRTATTGVPTQREPELLVQTIVVIGGSARETPQRHRAADCNRPQKSAKASGICFEGCECVGGIVALSLTMPRHRRPHEPQNCEHGR